MILNLKVNDIKIFAECREYASKVTQTVDIQSMGNTVQKVENTCSFVAIKHIIGGVEASEREFPHMALIGKTLLKCKSNTNPLLFRISK